MHNVVRLDSFTPPVYMGGIIFVFASTAAVLGASIPLAEPILQGSGLSELLDGRRISESTSLVVTTNRSYRSAADHLGYLKDIERAARCSKAYVSTYSTAWPG